MVKLQRGKQENRGPSSAIGLVRFNEADPSIVKLSPYFVLAVTGVIIIALIVSRNFLA